MMKLLITVLIAALTTVYSDESEKEKKDDWPMLAECCEKTSYSKENFMKKLQDRDNEKYSFCNTKESMDWVNCVSDEFKKKNMDPQSSLSEESRKVCEKKYEEAKEPYKNCKKMDCWFKMAAEDDEAEKNE